MTKAELIKSLARFDDDMQVVILTDAKSSRPKHIKWIKDFRMEPEDGFIQAKISQCAPSNVIVLASMFKL